MPTATALIRASQRCTTNGGEASCVTAVRWDTTTYEFALSTGNGELHSHRAFTVGTEPIELHVDA